MRNIIFAIVILHSFHGFVLSDFKCEKPDWFKCADNVKCIAHYFKCDGENDCGDFSDEQNCTNSSTFNNESRVDCATDHGFQCLDHTCIPENFVCDGKNDCPDSSDETPDCANDKPCYGFKCKDGHCIPMEQVCDGTNNCLDKSDEEHCFDTIKTPTEKCTSENGYFLCNSGDCILLSKVCNNSTDCPDGTDENVDGCGAAGQQCATGFCDLFCHETPKTAVCSCRPGYELRNQTTCVDIDECASEGTCDQGCENLEGTYSCSCESGYVLLDDKRTCKAAGITFIFKFVITINKTDLL